MPAASKQAVDTSLLWEPTRSAALSRLQDFVPHANRSYAAQRNYDTGPGHRDNVSCLSPWIRHRLLLEEEVVKAVLREHSPSAAEKFIKEVCWRTYWKGWLEMRPQVWHDYCATRDKLLAKLKTDSEMHGRWQEATDGNTGIECFDYWSEELVHTGYLHNHTRMWFASIWIFTLGLPWELGADFFLRHLLDGDPASNTLSRLWVAGLQTAGKTYLATADNIARYTRGRFKLAGQLSPQANSPQQALDDGIGWAEAHFQTNATRLPQGELAEPLLNWCRKHNLQQVVLPCVPTGNVKDRLQHAIETIHSEGVHVAFVRRS